MYVAHVNTEAYFVFKLRFKTWRIFEHNSQR